MTIFSPPRHIVWSTDRLELADPFQRKWYIRQVIEHGRADDIASLDLDEMARLLVELNLPPTCTVFDTLSGVSPCCAVRAC